MIKIINPAKKHKYLIYSFIIASFFLLITSKNSLLYPLNDWMDANAFFTVGKSMMNRVIPYKDLFEQKGPLLYVIYGIGSIISPKTFHGVFIIEILAFTIFLYYIHKLISLFIHPKSSFIILPIVTLLLTTSWSFTHGESCEELCLPFYAISLYYYTKHFIKEELTHKELFINGLIAGCVFEIKYTLLGFWFSFMMFIFFHLIFKKKLKQSILSCFSFLLGMFLPIFIFSFYFIVTGSLKDFISCYFTINMNSYGEKVPFITRLTTILTGAFSSIFKNGLPILILFITIPISLLILKAPKYYKISIIGHIIITAILLFWGLKFYRYYVFPLLFFTIIPLIACFYLSRKTLNIIYSKKYFPLFPITIFLLCIVSSYYNANYRDMIGMEKEELFQYRYAKYINSYENPTLLNMGNLDAGLYTTTGIIPTTRFFEVQNIPYKNFPDNLDEMEKYVRTQKTMFILYFTKKGEDVVPKDKYIYDYYDLVRKETQKCEEDIYYALLFKSKNSQS